MTYQQNLPAGLRGLIPCEMTAWEDGNGNLNKITHRWTGNTYIPNYSTDASGNVTGLVGPSGQIISVAQTYTWAQMQALASPFAGQRAYVSDQGLGFAEFIYNGSIWTRSTPLHLMGSGIPFIMQSSCTVGAATASTSAITGLTSFAGLSRTYPFPAYFYFTAGLGLTAGWYYVSVTGNTTATLYNNTYSGGLPVVPASPANFASLAGGSYTQYIAGAVTGPYFTIPAGMLGLNGGLRYTAMYAGYSTAAAQPYMCMGFGANPADNTNMLASGSITSTTIAIYEVQKFIRNCGSTGKQAVYNQFVASSFSGNASTGNTYTAKDTTVAQTAMIGMYTTVAADWIMLDAYNIEALLGS